MLLPWWLRACAICEALQATFGRDVTARLAGLAFRDWQGAVGDLYGTVAELRGAKLLQVTVPTQSQSATNILVSTTRIDRLRIPCKAPRNLQDF